MKNLIGRKIKGFEFKSYKYGDLIFNPEMGKYLGKIGTIQELNRCGLGVNFGDGLICTYPTAEIEQHLVKENVVTREQLAEIYEHVCGNWKEEIRKVMSQNIFSNEFEVDEALIQKARRSARTQEQRDWLDKVFGKDADELKIGDWAIYKENYATKVCVHISDTADLSFCTDPKFTKIIDRELINKLNQL